MYWASRTAYVPRRHCLTLIYMVSLYPSMQLIAGSASKEHLLYGLVDNRLSRGSFNGRPRPELDNDFPSRVRQCSAAESMKEALQCIAAFATSSASRERLLYGPVDNCLLRRRFNGRPRPEFDEHLVSTAVFRQH